MLRGLRTQSVVEPFTRTTGTMEEENGQVLVELPHMAADKEGRHVFSSLPPPKSQGIVGHQGTPVVFQARLAYIKACRIILNAYIDYGELDLRPSTKARIPSRASLLQFL